MIEELLGIDDFDRPKTLEGIETDIIVIIRLIMLEPGTIQSHPNMGVGLVSKWRYSSEEDLSNLEDIIRKQIIEYLPHLVVSTVNVKYQARYIVIDVVNEDRTIRLRTNSELSELYLDDILV